MELSFDISQLKWLFLFIFVVLLNIYTKRRKVDASQGEETDGEGSVVEQPKPLRWDELFGELLVTKPETVESPVEHSEAVPSSKMRVLPDRKIEYKKSILDDEISNSEISDQQIEAAKIADDFNLRDAVVMSEILSRKYED